MMCIEYLLVFISWFSWHGNTFIAQSLNLHSAMVLGAVYRE